MSRPIIHLQPILDILPGSVYDGMEPDDWYAPLQVPGGKAEWAFSLAELHKHPFEHLREILGESAFQQIMAYHGYRYPVGEFDTYVGKHRSRLYYFMRQDVESGPTILIFVSTGEFQPGRVIADVEGAWSVTGLDSSIDRPWQM